MSCSTSVRRTWEYPAIARRMMRMLPKLASSLWRMLRFFIACRLAEGKGYEPNDTFVTPGLDRWMEQGGRDRYVPWTSMEPVRNNRGLAARAASVQQLPVNSATPVTHFKVAINC